MQACDVKAVMRLSCLTVKTSSQARGQCSGVRDEQTEEPVVAVAFNKGPFGHYDTMCSRKSKK